MRHVLTTKPTTKNLSPRKIKELQALCLVLVIPYTGTKEKLITRILDVWNIRTKLKSYNLPEDIVANFKMKELKAMCKTVRKYSGWNKRSMAKVLLNWRNYCRLEGQRRVDEGISQVRVKRSESPSP